MNVHDPARFGDGASPIGADLYARHHGNFDAPLNSPRASRTRLIETGYERRRLQLRERRRLLYPPVGRQGRMTTGQDGNMVLPRRPAPVRPVDAVEPLPPPVARDQPKSRGVRLRCRPLAPCAPPAGSTGNSSARTDAIRPWPPGVEFSPAVFQQLDRCQIGWHTLGVGTGRDRWLRGHDRPKTQAIAARPASAASLQKRPPTRAARRRCPGDGQVSEGSGSRPLPGYRAACIANTG